jgi:hypothetical protein
MNVLVRPECQIEFQEETYLEICYNLIPPSAGCAATVAAAT